MLKSLASKMLFYYSTLVAFLILLSSFFSGSNDLFIFKLFYLPVAAYFLIEFTNYLKSSLGKKGVMTDYVSTPRRVEIIVLSTLFVALLLLGIRNVVNGQSLPSPEEAQTAPVVTEEEKPSLVFEKEVSLGKVKVQSKDTSSLINVRTAPSTASETLFKAEAGALFSYSRKVGEWYEVVLENGETGYLHFSYALDLEHIDQ